MLVITPRSGIISLLNLSISPLLSMPTSKTPNKFFFCMLNKLKGTPYLLLNDFIEYDVEAILLKD